MKGLDTGDRIFPFSLQNQNGEWVKIDPEDGIKRLIYFYPKDETKICKAQACAFRKWQNDFKDLDFEVVGISADSVKSHQAFSANNNLNFTLLSDSDNEIRKRFGAMGLWGLIPLRKTFLINENGFVIYAYNNFWQGEEHTQKALAFLKGS